MKTILILLAAICVIGCKTRGHLVAGDTSKLRMGMTREEVIKAVGKPDNVAASANEESLNYVLERPWWQDVPYRVKIVDGKVVSFGPEERPK